MRVGIVIQSPPSAGGAHGYENEFLRICSEEAKHLGIELCIFSPEKTKTNNWICYKNNAFRMLLSHLRSNIYLHRILGLIGFKYSHLERLAKQNKCNLLVFASPNHQTPGIHETPFASTAWDFGHLDQPQGTEVSLGGIWGWRQKLFESTLRRSLMVFCDSNSTKSRLIGDFGVIERNIYRVGLLPQIPGDSVEDSQGRPYLIYPSMFWPHKNHRVLILALAEIRARGGMLPDLVFTGSGAFQGEVKNLVSQHNLQDFVQFKGMVPRNQLAGLISGSRGLLMPSLIGPSNLPPLEAALLGVPSAISDVHEMDDLISGVEHVDALSPAAWAEVMLRLMSDGVPVGKLQDLDSRSQISAALQSAKKWIEPWAPEIWPKP